MPIPNTIDTFYNDYISGMDSTPLEAPVAASATEIIQDSQGTDNPQIDAQVPQTEQQQESTYEFPSFLDEQWKPPTDAQPEWYKDNYARLASSIGSEDFVKTITDTYAEQLLQTESDVTEAMRMYHAHKAGDVTFLRQHFPDALIAIGVSPVLTETEIDNQIEGTLKTEFGENYSDIYDSKDIVKPSSVSSKIFARQQELYKQWQSENQARQTKLESYKEQGTQITAAPSNEPNPEYIDAQYNTHFKDVPREQFDTMIEQIREGISSKWGLKEISRVLTYEADIAKAREEGIREGKGLLMKDIQTAGSAKGVVPQSNTPSTSSKGLWNEAQKQAERNLLMY